VSVEISILGPLEVRVDGEAIALRGGKQRALLAVLALEAPQVVPTETLIDRVWGESARQARRTRSRSTSRSCASCFPPRRS
jgi:DNA-binding SARP family transcriptional activator